jgi:hypothetical protein
MNTTLIVRGFNHILGVVEFSPAPGVNELDVVMLCMELNHREIKKLFYSLRN